MVSIGVSKLGKSSVLFIEKGGEINLEYYCSHAFSSLIPQMDNLMENDHVFTQDGARSHTAKPMIEYLNGLAPGFIKPDSWPPNSSDLNPMDYYVYYD